MAGTIDSDGYLKARTGSVMTCGLRAAFLPFFLVLASPLEAQRFDIGLTAPQCEAIVANALANPTRLDTLHLVRNCPGKFGPVMIELLQRPALMTNAWSLYKHIITFSASFREDDIFDAARDVAVDGSAPYLARVAALVILNAYTSGSVIPMLDRYVGYAGPPSGCSGGGVSATPTTWPGEDELSSSAGTQALSVAKTVLASSSAAGLKYLASCIETNLDVSGMGLVPVEVPSFTPSTDFSYVKQCGRKFLIRNASNAWVSMTLNLAPSSPPGPNIVKQWTAPPRPEGAAYSEHTWTAPGAGTAWIKQIPPGFPYLMPPTEVDVTPC
jgi:hypothetical protein